MVCWVIVAINDRANHALLVFISNKLLQDSFIFGLFCRLTSGGFVEVTFDQRNKLHVLAEASVVKCIVTQAVNCLHVGAALQQHLHCILTAVLAAQNQRRPEGGRQTQFTSKNMHILATKQLCH